MHIADREKCNWIRKQFEALQFEDIDKDEKLLMYGRMNQAH